MDKESVIVDMIGYNEQGHTVYTKPGNGTETTYAYDRERQWLQEMNLMAGGNAVMHNKYCYDAVDNILGISNAAARKFAKKYGGTVEKWEGHNGMMFASVTTRSYNATEVKIKAEVFKPSPSDQHNAAWNFLEAIDIPEGHADGANTGSITAQDIKVGFGIMGAMAGGLSLGGAEIAMDSQTIIGVLGIANSLDDAFTNTQGESLSQQLISEEYSEYIGMTKTGISIVSLGYDMWGIFKEGQVVNIIDASNTTISTIVDQIEKAYQEHE